MVWIHKEKEVIGYHFIQFRVYAGMDERRSIILLADSGGAFPAAGRGQKGTSLDFGTERVVCTCVGGYQRTWRSAFNVMVHF